MKTIVQQPADTISLTAPYDVASGGGAQAGAMFGIACDDVKSSAVGQFVVEGVFVMPKPADEGIAFSQGDLAYWDDSAKVVTSVSGGNALIGVAALDAADAVANVDVRLNGMTKGVQATGTASISYAGGITSVSVDIGGSGYASAPVVTITSDTGDGATATATIAAGVVTVIDVDIPGSGYADATVVVAAP